MSEVFLPTSCSVVYLEAWSRGLAIRLKRDHHLVVQRLNQRRETLSTELPQEAFPLTKAVTHFQKIPSTRRVFFQLKRYELQPYDVTSLDFDSPRTVGVAGVVAGIEWRQDESWTLCTVLTTCYKKEKKKGKKERKKKTVANM